MSVLQTTLKEQMTTKQMKIILKELLIRFDNDDKKSQEIINELISLHP